MKKLIFTLFIILGLSGAAFAQEELNIINPWRETFVNFPSASVGNTHRVTVFLPEEQVPLQQAYPVVYLLNAGPQEKDRAREWLKSSRQKALVVGLDFTEQDLQNTAAVVRFFSHELVPYIDTNYYTQARPSRRVIGGAGAQAAQTIGQLLAVPELFGSAVFVNPGLTVPLTQIPSGLRVFLRANAAQVRAWQEDFSSRGLTYGAGFVYRLNGAEDIFANLPVDYLLAPAAETKVKKAQAQVSPKRIFTDASAQLTVTAELKNGLSFDFLPETLYFTPGSLLWNPSLQTLDVRPGAAAGTVKIRTFVDNLPVKTKIKLKKQEK